MKTKFFLLPLAIVFIIAFASVVSAASVTTSVFYDATTESTLTVMKGDNVGVIVSADSIFEGYMHVQLDLISSTGSVTNLLSVHTTMDSYYNYLNVMTSSLNPGSYNIISTVTAASGQTDTSTLSLQVQAPTPGNNAPFIISTPVTQINEGQSYVYNVDATDADAGDTITYSLTQNPSWLSINAATGVISGTAPLLTSDYQFIATVRASDGTDFDTQTFTIDVKNVVSPPPTNTAPVITSTPITTVNEGAAYNYDVNAIDADGNTLTYSLTTSPGWLSINSVSGLISGTAPLVSANTPFTVTVSVSDGVGGIIPQTYTLTVVNVVVPPANNAPVANNQNVLAIMNSGAPITLTATDADGNTLTYSIVSNPAHGTIVGFNSVGGQLIYIPDTGYLGADSFTFRANDGIANSNVATVSITVNPAGPPVNSVPEITSTPVLSANECQLYNYDVDATDANGDTLTYSITANPGWLGINSASGLVTGTAPSVTANTAYSVVVSVSDGNGGSATQTYNINVVNSGTCPIGPPANNLPVITSTAVTSVNEGNVYSYDVNATDTDGNTLAYSLTTAPTWLSINSVSGLISGTAPLVLANTPFTVTVSVSDGVGGVTSQTYTLTVIDISSGGGSGGSGGSSGSSGRHRIPTNDFDEQNYLDQFNKKPVVLDEETPKDKTIQETSWLAKFLFWLFVLVLILAVLIIVALLTRN